MLDRPYAGSGPLYGCMAQWSDLPQVNPPIYDEESDVLVRQSIIGQLQFCPMRVALQGQEGFLETVSEPICFGTCVHHIIAEDLILDEGERLDMLTNMADWVGPILADQYDWPLEMVPNIRDFFSEIAIAYSRWRTDVRPLILNKKILGVEKQGELYLGEGKTSILEAHHYSNIFLGGTGDVVLEDTLVDWKTASKDWQKGKADLSIQASLYMPMYKQMFDVSIKKMEFWVFDRQKVAWNLHSTTRTIPQIDAALLTAYNYGLQLEAGIFPATPVPEASFQKRRGWYCSPKFCGGWNICKAKYLNDKVDEKVLAIRSWN